MINEPTSAGDRITTIDTLRGVAVLGILLMNIYGFAMPFAAYQNPLALGGTEWYNMATWFTTHILADQKFMTIFSILFGAGLVMMATRAEARGTKYFGVWYRRNFWLLLIGAAHAHFFWYGDILYHYAFVGLLIYPFRNRSPRALIITGTILLMVGVLFSMGGGKYMADLQVRSTEVRALQDAGEELSKEQLVTLEEWVGAAEFLKPVEEQVADDVAAYKNGSFSSLIEYRRPIVIMMETQAVIGFILWRVGGLMLIGMALMKLGVLSGERSPSVYKRMMMVGYGLGLPLMAYSAWILNAHQWDMVWMMRIGSIPNYFGSLLVAMGHIALIVTLVRTGALHSLMKRFTDVGRMAFTNYLTHTLVLTTVFYGYGLGLFGSVPRIGQMGFVVAVIGFQLWFSPFWLTRFRFGPAEWFWRSLTYWRLQPNRR